MPALKGRPKFSGRHAANFGIQDYYLHVCFQGGGFILIAAEQGGDRYLHIPGSEEAAVEDSGIWAHLTANSQRWS
jgi:hypothetical protein